MLLMSDAVTPQVLCYILHTAEFCRETVEGLSAAVKKDIKPVLADGVSVVQQGHCLFLSHHLDFASHQGYPKWHLRFRVCSWQHTKRQVVEFLLYVCHKKIPLWRQTGKGSLSQSRPNLCLCSLSALRILTEFTLRKTAAYLKQAAFAAPV